MSAIDFDRDIILDYEGYLNGNQVIIKELSLLSLRNSSGKTYMFKPNHPMNYQPDKLRRHVRYCSRNLNQIPYEAGDTSYSLLAELQVLLPMFCKRVLCKGWRKCEFLANFFNIPVVDLTSIGCPTFKVLNQRYGKDGSGYCNFHIQSGNYHCSQYKSKLMAEFLFDLANQKPGENKIQTP